VACPREEVVVDVVADLAGEAEEGGPWGCWSFRCRHCEDCVRCKVNDSSATMKLSISAAVAVIYTARNLFFSGVLVKRRIFSLFNLGRTDSQETLCVAV